MFFEKSAVDYGQSEVYKNWQQNVMPISVGLEFLRKLQHTKKDFQSEKKWVLELYIQSNKIQGNLTESDIKLILDCAPGYNDKDLLSDFS